MKKGLKHTAQESTVSVKYQVSYPMGSGRIFLKKEDAIKDAEKKFEFLKNTYCFPEKSWVRVDQITVEPVFSLGTHQKR